MHILVVGAQFILWGLSMEEKDVHILLMFVLPRLTGDALRALLTMPGQADTGTRSNFQQMGPRLSHCSNGQQASSGRSVFWAGFQGGTT